MPAQIPDGIGSVVSRDGSAPLASIHQATLAAAGFSRLGAGEPGRQELQTAFEKEPAQEQSRLAAEAEAEAEGPVVELVVSIARDNFTGTLWIPGPGDGFNRQSWFTPLGDGSPALLDARIELDSSTYAFSVVSLHTHAEVRTADMFTGPVGDAPRLGIMRIVWPHRGRARAIDISVLRDEGGVRLTEVRSFGAKKKRGPDDVDEEALTRRLLDALTEAYG